MLARIDNLIDALSSIDQRQVALLGSLEGLLARDNQAAITIVTQQRAIDQLAARITKIERELHPGQQQ